MLPRKHRLRLGSDVRLVRHKGRRFRHPLVILLITKSSQLEEWNHNGASTPRPPSRFAFVASRRVGSAVKRNKAKRLMREALRSQMEKISPGWDGIFIARQDTVCSSLAEIKTAAEELLSRASVLQDPNE